MAADNPANPPPTTITRFWFIRLTFAFHSLLLGRRGGLSVVRLVGEFGLRMRVGAVVPAIGLAVGGGIQGERIPGDHADDREQDEKSEAEMAPAALRLAGDGESPGDGGGPQSVGEVEGRGPDGEEIEDHDDPVAEGPGVLAIPKSVDAGNGGLEGLIASGEKAAPLAAPIGEVIKGVTLGISNGRGMDFFDDVVNTGEAPVMERADVEGEEGEKEHSGPTLEGVAKVAAVGVFGGVEFDAGPGDVEAVEGVDEERDEDDGELDEPEHGLEGVDFVDVDLEGLGAHDGASVDEEVGGDVSTEQEAKEGVDATNPEMAPAGGFGIGVLGRFLDFGRFHGGRGQRH